MNSNFVFIFRSIFSGTNVLQNSIKNIIFQQSCATENLIVGKYKLTIWPSSSKFLKSSQCSTNITSWCHCNSQFNYMFQIQLSHWAYLSTVPTFVLVFAKHTISEHFLTSVPPVCTGLFHLASKPLSRPCFGCLRMAVCRLDSREFGGCRLHRCYIDHLHTMWQTLPCTPYIPDTPGD